MKKCKQCNKISYSLINGLCKRCSKTSSSNINQCTRCKKITAYNVDGLCVECAKRSMSIEKIIAKLKLKDPKELSAVLKIGEKVIIEIATDLKIEGFRKHQCNKCGKYIEKFSLCDECYAVHNTLKNIDHLKKLREISNNGEVLLHDKTK